MPKFVSVNEDIGIDLGEKTSEEAELSRCVAKVHSRGERKGKGKQIGAGIDNPLNPQP